MTGITIRRASAADAAALAEMRVALAREGGIDEALAPDYLERCSAFFSRAILDGTVRSWIALDGDLLVGAATLELHPTLPRLRPQRALDGRVRSVFVLPSYRRRGIGRTMMLEILAEAGRERVDRLGLGTSQMGRALYESLGFVPRPTEMILGLEAARTP